MIPCSRIGREISEAFTTVPLFLIQEFDICEVPTERFEPLIERFLLRYLKPGFLSATLW